MIQLSSWMFCRCDWGCRCQWRFQPVIKSKGSHTYSDSIWCYFMSVMLIREPPPITAQHVSPICQHNLRLWGSKRVINLSRSSLSGSFIQGNSLPSLLFPQVVQRLDSVSCSWWEASIPQEHCSRVDACWLGGLKSSCRTLLLLLSGFNSDEMLKWTWIDIWLYQCLPLQGCQQCTAPSEQVIGGPLRMTGDYLVTFKSSVLAAPWPYTW